MPLPPTSIRTLSPEDASHLLRRTSFGATDAEIQALVGASPADAAEKLLSFPQTLEQTNFSPLDAVGPGPAVKLIQGDWLWQMLYTPYPLRERLALLWSNHFVVGVDKVKNVYALQEYLSLLRSRSLGNFTTFAVEIGRSPAMLRYLDNDQNKKGKPNENFSRELLELFTTGIGHYSETDVLEGARALTGWTFQGGRNNQQDYAEQPKFVFNQKQHDNGSKTYLGQTGNFAPADIISLATNHPATAVRVAGKLWAAFVSSTPDENGIAALAQTFSQSGGDLRATVKNLLTSEAFYSAANRSSVFRSPVEYVVGAVRSMGRPPMTEKAVLSLVAACSRMGQELLHPPTVKGWDGGREWINDTTLLLRMQTAAALTLGNNAPKGDPLTPLSVLGRSGALQGALGSLNAKQRSYLMLISPEYQLI
ncbi:DUF1800 domain-containing protein [Deinococcus ruber]|uniref:DUF1800 domain-containing protein n=1 Tax=Deinococcus ruber TaxID=1848197 RepID=A0A918C2R5_9DEIO|nr:DUF1800 domain-containing protein [Deinococcus ruber]GGR02720.1 hypothetical protein GCM10008957_14680 [Deinococcus ruber]